QAYGFTVARRDLRDDLDPHRRDALIDELVLHDVRAIVRAALGARAVRVGVALDDDDLVRVDEALRYDAHLLVAHRDALVAAPRHCGAGDRLRLGLGRLVSPLSTRLRWPVAAATAAARARQRD